MKKPERPKRQPTTREVRKMQQAMEIFKDCTDDEMAAILNACIYLLGDRIAKRLDRR